MVETILLTIDSLRADRLDERHFPECIDRFRSDFVTFENALSHGVATPFAFPGILNGRPVGRRASLRDDEPTTAELFDGPTLGFTNNPQLTADRGYDRGFDEFRCPDPTEAAASFPPYEPAGSTLADLDEALDAEPYEFVWWHLMDSHYPHTPYATLDRPTDPAVPDDEIEEMNYRFVDEEASDDQLSTLREYYDGNVGYLDRQLAEFLRSLEERGEYDRRLIVIVSDHGETFGERGRQGHPFEVDPIDELVRTPVLVKYPEGEHAGRTFDHLVAHSDVNATVARYADSDAKADTDACADTDASIGGTPLTDRSPRAVVSKSNTAIRVTTPDGHAVARRDGSIDVRGSVGDDALDALSAEPFPNVSELTDGYEELEDCSARELQERLADLGYR